VQFLRVPKEQTLYIRSMRKALKVTAIFQDLDAANEYMKNNRNEGCVAEFNGLILLANLYDRGTKIQD